MNSPETLAAALRYIERGRAIFPLHSIDANGCCTCGNATCSDAGKHPRARRGLKEASKDRAQIETWFGPDAPLSNIGLATGAASGITVLDIDIGEGKDGAATWAALIEGHGEPQTLMANTGSGGIHVFFKYNSALKTSTNTLGPNVDCRNDGGYVVAPPSLHRSGRRYEWVNEDETIADLPPHLSRRVEKRGRKRKDDPIGRTHFTLEEVAEMLEKVPPDDRDLWRATGIILGRTFKRSGAAWQLYQDWSNKWKGTPGRDHNEKMHEAFYVISTQTAQKELSMGTIVRHAIANGWVQKLKHASPIDCFLYYAPGNSFIYTPTGDFWVAEAVNKSVAAINTNGKLIRPTDWLAEEFRCTSMTNDPDLEGDYVRDIDYRKGSPLYVEGAATFNLYRPPTIELGDARLAGPFLDHVRKVFNKPGDADQFLDYMAHRAQHPGKKARFALLIAGEQGCGKDTAIEFCVPAIGPWNVANIDGGDIESNFNEHAAAVLVRVSEAAKGHDLGKWAFNERTKVLIAGKPDDIKINPKYGKTYSVRMHCGVVLTTNHMIGGLLIPADDRRYDVIETATKAEMGIDMDEKAKAYFAELWNWFDKEGGDSHVAAFLMQRDLSKFSADNGQRKTEAHKQVVMASQVSDTWLIEALAAHDDPDLVRTDSITQYVLDRNEGWKQQEIGRNLAPAMKRCGYIRIRSKGGREDGWHSYKDDGKRSVTTIYGRPEVQVDKNLQTLINNLQKKF